MYIYLYIEIDRYKYVMNGCECVYGRHLNDRQRDSLCFFLHDSFLTKKAKEKAKKKIKIKRSD